MLDTLRLTAEEAARLLRDKEVSAAELFAAYRAAIDERDPSCTATCTSATTTAVRGFRSRSRT